ncbi:hypothetical protein Vretimale_18937 [Volvox reticuliferus]|nr:hypothetical protein Vretifemale_17278 [Volvox reticuliferus]GIM16290.1 hypothetical protein Vretimale_18937 [Volvox reticuliferus]
MSIDGDMALFAPASDIAAPYMEDIVSACIFTSQFLIVNNITSVHQYCEYMGNYFTQDHSSLQKLGAVLGRTAADYLKVSDMELLQLFLQHNPSISRGILCPEAPGVPVCNANFAGCLLSSQVQAIESFFKVRYNQSSDSPWIACRNVSAFRSIVKWRSDSRGVPVPVHRGTGECFPVIHFQGDCKGFIPVFAEYYREVVREMFEARHADPGGRRELLPGEQEHVEWVRKWVDDFAV